MTLINIELYYKKLIYFFSELGTTMKKTMFAGLAIVATIAVVMVGLAVIPVAYAVHNGEGHSDKSVVRRML